MSAYSKNPGGNHLDPIVPDAIRAMDPAPAPTPAKARHEVPLRSDSAGTPLPVRPYHSALSRAPSLLLEMAQVADYCRTLEKTAHDEQIRADEVRARVEEDRAKFQQELLNAKLETRRYGGELKKAATEIQALIKRQAQAAHQIEEMARKEEAARRVADEARGELTSYRTRAEAERDSLNNRLRAAEQDFKAAAERAGKREAQLLEQIRGLEIKVKEQDSAADLSRLEMIAVQGRVQAASKQLERNQVALRAQADIQTRYQAIHERCAAFERTLADGKAKYQALIERNQRNEIEVGKLREANRALTEANRAFSEKTAEVAASADTKSLAAEATAVRKANAELRKENEGLTAELARARKHGPLIELLQLKERELERLAEEFAKTPESDTNRRGAISARQDAVILQRDQLSLVLKRQSNV